MGTRIDHLVIAADTLEQGVAYIKDCFGVDIPYGGAHMKMGTHNHLMQLGDEIFLEIIAINPDLKPPQRPRWFSLDDHFIQQQLKSTPLFVSWVVNTDNIEALLKKGAVSFGEVEMLSRNQLHWKFALPEDGRLLAGGMLPNLIEWQTDTHPAIHMTDCQCSLQALEVHHPYPAWLGDILLSIDAEELVTIYPLPANTAPYLKAYINTPNGVKELTSNLPLR